MISSIRFLTFSSMLFFMLLFPLRTAYSTIGLVVPFSDVYPSDNSSTGWLDSLVFRYSSNDVWVKYYYPRGLLLVLFQLGDGSPSRDDLILIALDLDVGRSEHLGDDDVLFLVRRTGSSNLYGGRGGTWHDGAHSVSLSYRATEFNSSYTVFMEVSVGELLTGQEIRFAIGQVNDHEIIDYPPGSSDENPSTWGIFKFFDWRVIEELPGEQRLCRTSETLMRICYF